MTLIRTTDHSLCVLPIMLLCAAGTLNTVVPALPLLKATAAAGRPAAIAITSSVSVLPKDAVLFAGEQGIQVAEAVAAQQEHMQAPLRLCCSLKLRIHMLAVTSSSSAKTVHKLLCVLF
jgi:hypothetical protein